MLWRPDGVEPLAHDQSFDERGDPRKPRLPREAGNINEKRNNMSTKLFVGSLSWNTTGDELRDAFAACGEVVEAKVIMNRDTGRSRGFGFVTYQNEDGAARAIETLDGSTLDGRSIRVDRANDRGSDTRKSVGRW